MRVATLALISVLAMAACSKAPGTASTTPSASNPGGVIGSMFPNLFQTAFRADGTIIRQNGQTMPIVMIRSGQNMRMEMDTSQGHMVMIRNADTHDMYTIMTMRGRQIAMRADTGSVEDPMQIWASHQNSDPHTHFAHGGPCTEAGELGSEWTVTRDDQTPPVVRTACVTSDGIILQAKEGDRVVWQTTRVQRGVQSPALFTLPPGVQVMNLGNAGSLLSQLHGGAKPATP